MQYITEIVPSCAIDNEIILPLLSNSEVTYLLLGRWITHNHDVINMNSADLFFLVTHRAPNKSNDAHLVVFALPVFQCQLKKKKEREKCNINKYSKWFMGKSSGVLTHIKFWAMQLCKTSPKALISLLVIPNESRAVSYILMTVRYSHVPPWCQCRNWCFPEVAQHAAWTESCLRPGSVLSTLRSCCREAIFVTLWHSYKPVCTNTQHYFQQLLCHCDQAHVVFRVAACFGVANDVDRVLLSLKPCGQEVSISHVLTVVHTSKKINSSFNLT